MQTIRVVIYARVSTRDKGQDTENQLRQLREFCQRQDWQIVREYVDRASGKHSDREQFQAMFDAASRREFDVVLFWSLDRFSREGVYATLQHLQRLTSHGISYKSLSEQFLDSCGLFRDAIISILATLARQERIRLSERVLAGLQRAKAQGRVGGRPRLASEKDKLRGKHAQSLAKMRELQASGMSLSDIAKNLGLPKSTVYSRLTAT